tara:strand:+ start:791 stop:1414 length:624 start_codon:yes stop_codon:yes gene_type:complete
MYTQDNNIEICEKNRKIIVKNDNEIKNNNFFLPEQKDTLFWCFYNVYNKDMLNTNPFTTEKIFKINFVEIARKNKDLIKINKLKLNDIEDDLVNNDKITKKTLLILSIYYEVNFIIIEKFVFYKIIGNIENDYINIIVLDKDKYKLYIGNETYNYNAIEAYKIDKPIKAISGYKVDELRDLAKKLDIDVKNKNKNLIYQDLIDKIYN